jgi:transposase InsO family protein
MAAELVARGHPCSENTVARLMRRHGIRAKAPRRFVRTIDSRHGLPVAENVLGRRFAPAGPNAAWGADITDIPTADGWLYLALVEDLFSRMIVGWAMAGSMTSRLVVDALAMAVRRRVPAAGLRLLVSQQPVGERRALSAAEQLDPEHLGELAEPIVGAPDEHKRQANKQDYDDGT